MKNKTRLLKIRGISMEPILRQGDIVFLSEENKYQIGDVVVFKYMLNGKIHLLSHRLLLIKNDIYYTKGDNSLNIEKIKQIDIVGKIVAAERDGRKLNLKIKESQLKDLCDYSYRCGLEYEKGNIVISKIMAKRIYINLCKISLLDLGE